MAQIVKNSYKGIVKTENFLGHFFLLLVRVYWGSLLIMTGIGKWANISSVASYFGELGVPYPMVNAYLVATFELLGGASLFLGLFARISTIALIAVFGVAYATAHQEALRMFFSNPSLFISQDPFLYLYASLIVFCFGAGMFSFDYWMERKAYGAPL